VKYTSGGITSLGKFAQAYGRFEMRAKFPASGIGLQPAFWMIPANPKSTGRYEYGEIDIAEAYTMRADSVGAHLHYVTTPGTAGAGMRCSVPGSQTGYHTYTLEWTTTTLKFVYDGKTCWQTGWKPKAGYGGGRVAPAPFDQPFYVMVQLAVGGPKTPDNVPKQQTVFPANMYVDYVRVWK
jgi:beta-glucanase (GH16 family)